MKKSRKPVIAFKRLLRLHLISHLVTFCKHNSGSAVKSSFNLMGDSTEERSGPMSMATFSAFQTCKYAIRSTGKSSLQIFKRQDTFRDAGDAHNLIFI